MKSITKLLLGLMAIVLTLGMSATMQSCGGASASAIAKTYNKQCPVDMGNGATLTSVEADGSTLVLNITVPDIIGIKAIRDNMDKGTAVAALKAADSDLIESCKALGISLKFVYRDSSDSGELLITPDDM